MSGYVKTFFSPSGVMITLLLTFYLCALGIGVLTFMDRLTYWSNEQYKTQVYFQQPVCQDSEIRAQTEGKNKCDEYAVFLKTSPARRALLDVLESNYVCAGGSCVRWFEHLLIFFSVVSLVILYMVVRHTQWTMETVDSFKTSIPFIIGGKRKKAQ